MRRLLLLALVAALNLPAVAQPAGAATIRWAAARDIGSLDPDSYGDTFTLAFLNHVYEGLVRYDAALQIEPALATSWEVLEPTRWRFHLRPGVHFQDGAPLTADDVVASLKRATDDLSPLKGNLPAFKDARAVDPLTVDMDLNTAYPLLLNDLTNIFIFSKPWLVANHAEAPTDFGKGIEGYATHAANGTGPFSVLSRATDQGTILVRNPAWWDKPQHNVDRIEFRPINNDATRIAALVSGQVDFTNAVPLQATQRLEGSPGVKLLLATELRTVFFALNYGAKTQAGEPNPLRDERVRRAMLMALDADGIRRSIMRGLSRTTGAIVAPAIPGYVPSQDERPPYDPDAAKALLAAAGYPQGFGLSLVCSTDSYVSEEQLCTAASAMWAKIGVRITPTIGPRAVITPRRVAGEFDITTLGWANEPAIDALSILVQVVRSKQGASGIFNWGGWGQPEIDRLTDDASNELDRPKRLAMMQEALKIAHDRVLFLPLHQQPMAWATRDTVESVSQLPDNKVRLWLTRLKP
jgi:peptide/nickel transport system substrate-binding protein